MRGCPLVIQHTQLWLAAHLADVPVVPDAETAREWAVRELSDPIYHGRESLIAALLRWIEERLAETQQAVFGFAPGLPVLVFAVLILGIAVVALLVAGPIRRSRRAGRASTEVFDDDTRTSDQLRASADAHAAAGRWSEAVLDRFRALLRSLIERALLDERPGMTAHEAAVAAGDLLPSVAADLMRAGRLFDDVRYGDVAATAADDDRLREVDQAVGAARRAPVPGPAQTTELAVPR